MVILVVIVIVMLMVVVMMVAVCGTDGGNANIIFLVNEVNTSTPLVINHNRDHIGSRQTNQPQPIASYLRSWTLGPLAQCMWNCNSEYFAAAKMIDIIL